MSYVKRLGAIFAACLLFVAAATPLASAQDAPLEPELTMEIGGPAYAVRGGEATIWFKLTNTGTAPVNKVEWKSSICELPDPEPEVVLGIGKVFEHKCKVPVPDDPVSWLIEGKAAADYRGNGTETSAELRLYAATIHKEVVRYWKDGLKVVDPSSDDVKFPVKLFQDTKEQGVEHVSVAKPLGLLVQEGLWEFTEIRPFPAGYEAIIAKGEFQAPTRHVERLLTNLATFDLKVEKSGPVWAYEGDVVVWTYKVTNAGPASVKPAISDDECGSIAYIEGDRDKAGVVGMVDPGETWIYKCRRVPDWNGKPFTNTVKVSDADYPQRWTPARGGDVNPRNNMDSFTLYPLTVEKAMFLYYGRAPDQVPIDGFERVEFGVALSRNGTHVTNFPISEAKPVNLWLSEGSWKVLERRIPDGFKSAAPNGFTVDTKDYKTTVVYPNTADFDLKVEKSGPVWAYEGDVVIWTYEVTNDGPASVTPAISDDKCGSIAYIEGDRAKSGVVGKVDPGETWIYKCRRIPKWDGKTPFTNTVRVWDKEGVGIDPPFGGDVNLRNNTDSFTLYPLTVEKEMFLYYGRTPDQVPIKGFEKVEFGVALSRNGTHITNFPISEAKPVKLWLSEGPWKVVENRIPVGFKSAKPDGFKFDTKDYETTIVYPNTADFDLKVHKKLWWGEPVPGKWIAYKYKVMNEGPASVAPHIEDDTCAPLVFKWGDKNGNKLVDPGETWVYKCKYRIPYGVHEVTNVVEVRDVEGKGLRPAFGGDVNLENNTATLTLKVGWYGCPHWSWKNPAHLEDWPSGYDPDMPVGPVFGLWAKLDLNRDGTPDTMLDALHYKSGHGIKAAKKMLLKAAVTNLLNEAAFDVLAPAFDSIPDLKQEVKRAYKSGKKWKMKKLTKYLNHWNLGHCPL